MGSSLNILHSQAFCDGGEAGIVAEFRFHAVASPSDGGVVRPSAAFPDLAQCKRGGAPAQDNRQRSRGMASAVLERPPPFPKTAALSPSQFAQTQSPPFLPPPARAALAHSLSGGRASLPSTPGCPGAPHGERAPAIHPSQCLHESDFPYNRASSSFSAAASGRQNNRAHRPFAMGPGLSRSPIRPCIDQSLRRPRFCEQRVQLPLFGKPFIEGESSQFA